jgi:hypothetical protein
MNWYSVPGFTLAGTVSVPLPVKIRVCTVAAAHAAWPQKRAVIATVRGNAGFMGMLLFVHGQGNSILGRFLTGSQALCFLPGRPVGRRAITAQAPDLSTFFRLSRIFHQRARRIGRTGALRGMR